jgi:type III restriction enzyme
VASLYQKLKQDVEEWKRQGYPSSYPSISTILQYNQSNFLRKAQLEALETYWYLRLIKNNPKIFDLYQQYFEGGDLLDALGVILSQEDWKKIALSRGGIESVIERIKSDDTFVKNYQLEGLRETLNLDYPSYILALAMGAGKTILIASIIATEFAMALEYRDENGIFVQNALVFAPGKTILGALREISDTPYDKILPPRFYKSFITNVKFTYTRDGEKDIPVIRGSSFNVIVTNTEKIRLQKNSIPKSFLSGQLRLGIEEAKELVANLRLQTITSLPHLAIFSDEAHHTYGQELANDLKRVRQTINYIAEKTNLLVVVNTTGTPYFQRQLLRDVIYWYGLSQGIADGILKEVRGNIIAYSDVSDKDFITDVLTDFFNEYRDVKVGNGEYAKFAIYFPSTEDSDNAKSIVEQTLISLNIDPSIVLQVDNRSTDEVKDLFDNRINDPKLKYRVFLLVNKGTEGWNCLSLFATALARRLTSSNNFVLQAASRCLRQVNGNTRKAKIYLSEDNVSILDRQLQETFGEGLEDLNRASTDTSTIKLTLRKVEIEPLYIKKLIKRIVLKDLKAENNLKIEKPDKPTIKEFEKTIYSMSKSQRKGVLIEVETKKGVIKERKIDLFQAAVVLAQAYRLDSLKTYKLLEGLYPEGEIGAFELELIRSQIEELHMQYQVVDEIVEEALALIKQKGFEEEIVDGKISYVTHIRVNKTSLERYMLWLKDYKARAGQLPLFGFHYDPYNFDSEDERRFFEWMLAKLGEDSDNVEDIYYTGAINDPAKTDFIFEYKDNNGDWHNYTPDFLIRKKDGKSLIVEVKAPKYRTPEAEKEMRRLEAINQDKIKYELLLLEEGELFSKVKPIINWIYHNHK